MKKGIAILMALLLCLTAVPTMVSAEGDGEDTPEEAVAVATVSPAFQKKLFTELNIIGFDIVEIAPPLDDSLASMYAGRKLLTEGWGAWAEYIGKLEAFA